LETGFDDILFSYHGIPVRQLFKTGKPGEHDCSNINGCCSDTAVQQTCYRHQVIQTTQRTAELLNLTNDQFSVSFQSRLGSTPWLEPFTDHVLKLLPLQGIKKLLVVCPAFVTDCLETLEEIAVEGKNTFLNNGGTQYEMIPALNIRPEWIDVMLHLIKETDLENELR
jgi:ferrochelatase